jgi:hypothetical protein
MTNKAEFAGHLRAIQLVSAVGRLPSFSGLTWWAKSDAELAVSSAAVACGIAKESRFACPPYRRFRFHRRTLATLARLNGGAA